MTPFKKLTCAALAVTVLAGSVVGGSTQAEARSGSVAVGLIGGLALGAMAAQAAERPVYVERRHVRRAKLHYVGSRRCGCVVHHHYVAR
jgi:hypothetical protein